MVCTAERVVLGGITRPAPARARSRHPDSLSASTGNGCRGCRVRWLGSALY
ncbi:hypothetical protein SSCG_05521 [Streptomyces clavuligerus]|nr:hypothetical protein SSCG_05521 [Streptomyces clavuligerus]